MRRGRLFIFLALILVLGLVVVYFVMQRFQTSGTPSPLAQATPTAIPTVDVVVVTQHVNRGQLIDDSVVGVVPYQRDLFINGMVTNKADVVGKRAKLDLEAGFVMTQNMVTETPDLSTSGSDAALMIPRGMVAVSIPINRLSSVTFAPQRGDHVNVLATMLFTDLDADFQSALPNGSGTILAAGNSFLQGPQLTSSDSTTTNKSDPLVNTLTNQTIPSAGVIGRTVEDPAYKQPFYVLPSEKQRPRLVSQTLIQDVIVLQMGDFPTESSQPTPVPTQSAEAVPTPTPLPNKAIVGTTPTVPDMITLIVTPQDAVTLNYMIYSGAKLTLVLRSSGDDTRVQTEAVTLQFLMDQYKVPIPAKLPYGLEPRVDNLEGPAQSLQPTPTPRP
jgi:Flp pilus assembly protein CpaB